jgi:membrane protease YdiL (CAAX protease family)
LGSCLTGLLYAYLMRRFRSIWMAIITHSTQSVLIFFLILRLVLGQAGI